MTPELKRETDRKLANYKVLNRQVEKNQILFVGSSLMEMFPIERFIKERNLPIIAYNRGVGGFKTEDMLQVLDVCVYELSPRRVFINIGTNDLSDPAIPMEQIMANYDEILRGIKAHCPDVELYLMAYYPVNYEAAPEEMKACLKIRNNEKILKANQEVQKLAQKHGARYIDVNAPLKDSNGNLKAEYSIDGMHITPEGYLSILDAVLRYATEPKW